MKLFGKKPQVQLILSEKDKKRTDEVKGEIEGKNFDKAMELVVNFIEDCREKDPYAEAHYSRLASSILVKKYGQKIPLSEYNQAKRYLDRALEICRSFGKDKCAQLYLAEIQLQIANLDLIIGKPEEGLPYCRMSLEIYEKLGNREGAARANTILWFLGVGKLTSEVQDHISFMGPEWKGFKESSAQASRTTRSKPALRCPVDGLRCPLGESGTIEERKNCPAHKCPLAA